MLATCQREVAKTPEAQAILKTPGVARARSTFRDTFSKIGVRLRSLSPSKSRRRPLVEGVIEGMNALEL